MEHQETHKHEEHTEKPRGNWYQKNYKLLLVLPAILIILSLSYLVYFYAQNGDIIRKDVSLTGGTTITIFSEIDRIELEAFLSQSYEDFEVRELSDLRTGRQEAVIIQTPISIDTDDIKSKLEEFLGFKLDGENSSTEFTGSTLSSSFYSQLRFAIILAFILMAIVVFIIFRTFVPSLAVILSAFADIVMTLALINIFGMKISAAGIVAFLMLIGYSVDTDIMLTTKLVKRKEGTINERLLSAFKTGTTMTVTSIIAVLVALLMTMSFSEVLRQIFTILTIGLFLDLFNTWITNASILKWYVETKERN